MSGGINILLQGEYRNCELYFVICDITANTSNSILQNTYPPESKENKNIASQEENMKMVSVSFVPNAIKKIILVCCRSLILLVSWNNKE